MKPVKCRICKELASLKERVWFEVTKDIHEKLCGKHKITKIGNVIEIRRRHK